MESQTYCLFLFSADESQSENKIKYGWLMQSGVQASKVFPTGLFCTYTTVAHSAVYDLITL